MGRRVGPRTAETVLRDGSQSGRNAADAAGVLLLRAERRGRCAALAAAHAIWRAAGLGGGRRRVASELHGHARRESPNAASSGRSVVRVLRDRADLVPWSRGGMET